MKNILLILILVGLVNSVDAASRRALLTQVNVAAAGGGDSDYFTPSVTNSMVFWFAPSSSDTNDAALLSYLSNRSTNTQHVSMSDSGKMPTFNASDTSINNKPSLTFNGNDGSLTNLQNLSIGWGNPVTFYTLLEAVPTANFQYAFDGAITTHRNSIAILNDETASMYAGSFVTGGILPTPQWYVFSGVFNGATSYTRTNGVSYVSGNPGSAALRGFTLGNRYLLDDSLAGSIGVLLLYDGAHDSNTLQNIESELLTWGGLP